MKPNIHLDRNKITKLILSLIDNATCLICCKFYISPETGVCGHTFCNNCWRKQYSCKLCKAPLDYSTLRPNVPIENLAKHVHILCDSFDKIFNIKVESLLIDNSLQRRKLSEESLCDMKPVENLTTTAEFHGCNNQKNIDPLPSVAIRKVEQDDWEKIEHYSDDNDVNNMNHCQRSSKSHFSTPMNVKCTETTAPKDYLEITMQVYDTKTVSSPIKVVFRKVENYWKKIETFSETDSTIDQILDSNDVNDWLKSSTNHFPSPAGSVTAADKTNIEHVESIAQINNNNVPKQLHVAPSIIVKEEATWENNNLNQDENGNIKKIESKPDLVLHDLYDRPQSQHLTAVAAPEDIEKGDNSENIVNGNDNVSEKVSPYPIVVANQVAQDDWDKIEQLSDSDELTVKKTREADDMHEYTKEHPRRSSRKRALRNYGGLLDGHYCSMIGKRQRK